ncbi:CRISPR-associated endoribonuclease Cas6 [Thermolongibacillus altinsuensis]|uniref:CRISPR-associated endoribonuclease Cas6 n=1 Tax=Thermolongibacillus altinsuensis TaxID=575256 RepID=A0A4R1QK83_9BACL|nr:CRISPR-associated endoribonuclease Cas6 [Thermolongibacillus altinsuensis]TCL52008.1 CRISPR-associated endoribonuclease Cas6 [Thermolongibacillus altinsuensis]
MRFSCFFRVSKIPICYRMAIVSIIKEALRTSNQEYCNYFYSEKRQKTKPFVFSVYLKNFKIMGDEIHLDGMNVTFSSPDYEFLMHLYNGLQQKKTFFYKEYEFRKENVRLLKEKQFRSSTVVFRTLSPILVEDEHGAPVSPDQVDYPKHLNYLANLILFEYRGKGLQSPLSVRPLRYKKIVVKESNHQFAEEKGDNCYLYFTAYHGQFIVQGHPEDLQLLYQLGLSKRRNQGFGQLEVEEVRG